MEKKTFYTLYRRKNLTGIEKQEGFRTEKDGTELYVYMDREGCVHVVDPRTGASILQKRCSVDEIEDQPALRYAMATLKHERESEHYRLMARRFRLLLAAAMVDEKMRTV